MKSLLLTSPKDDARAKKLSKLASKAGFRVETRPLESLKGVTTIPDITLVGIDNPANLAGIVRDVAQIQSHAPKRSRVLFSVGTKPRSKKNRTYEMISALTSHLKIFPNPNLVEVTFEQPADHMIALLDVLGSKIDLEPEASGGAQAAPRPSPLDDAKEVIGATEDLRVANGKLSAEAIAKAFKISISELANWLGRSRQAISKTPDADSLQNELGFFERVARLRTVVPRNGFLKWLRMPNRELDGKQPLELMARGNRQVVADLVDDMLTGAPA